MLPPFQTVSCIPGCLDDPELLVFLSLRPMLRSHRDPPLCQAYAALRITLRTLCMLGTRSLFINSSTILAPYFFAY